MVWRTLFSLALATAASAAPLASLDGPQLVLLTNGGVLRGDVRLIGDTYHITDDGTDIRLPARDVRFVESSLERIADRMRAEQPSPGVEDRLRTAAWCRQQQLWGHAARELMAAQRESPNDPRVAWAQRRLWHAREEAMRPPQPAPARVDPAVMPAAYSEPAGAAPTASPPTSPPPEQTLSDDAVQEFTRHVQPILVNNCTTAGCHAPNGPQEFQLDRSLLHGLSNRRSTRANLIATLRAIDTDHPENSPLLQAMRPSHAGGRGLPRNRRGEQLRTRVADWVVRVAGQGPSPNRAAPPETSPATDEAKRPPTPRVLAEGDVYAPGYFEALRDLEAASRKGADGATAAEQPAVKRGVRLRPVREERDEFDPETFNERYGDQSAGEPSPR